MYCVFFSLYSGVVQPSDKSGIAYEARSPFDREGGGVELLCDYSLGVPIGRLDDMLRLVRQLILPTDQHRFKISTASGWKTI